MGDDRWRGMSAEEKEVRQKAIVVLVRGLVCAAKDLEALPLRGTPEEMRQVDVAIGVVRCLNDLALVASSPDSFPHLRSSEPFPNWFADYPKRKARRKEEARRKAEASS